MNRIQIAAMFVVMFLVAGAYILILVLKAGQNIDENDSRNPSGHYMKKEMASGLSIGLALGIAMGIALDSLALGVAIGVAIGCGIGNSNGSAQEKKHAAELRLLTEGEKHNKKIATMIGAGLVALGIIVLIVTIFLTIQKSC